jgi:spermidine/putrescine transport system substrate-binding protein
MIPGAFSRRELLRRAGVGAGALGLGAILVACGADDAPPSFHGEPSDILNFANWPLYIDKVRTPTGNRRPSLDAFTRQTGIQVNYREVIPDADTFFHQIEPYLAAKEPTGWDLIVITNGITLTTMREDGYLVALPSDLRPNFDRYAGSFVKDPPYDPGNRSTMAWQSGITGIAYDPDQTGRPITSLQDLFSDEFAGRVGMFGDVVDMPNLAILATGADPETSTEDDWRAAAHLLRLQRDAGIIRGYYEQNYISALRRGELALTMAWSGDIFAAKIEKSLPAQIEFVVPDEGALLWTDCMCVPAGAEHLADAITFMDYVYRPDVAAQIAQYVNYITPVPAARGKIEAMAQAASGDERARLEEVARSPLVFPDAATLAGLSTYRELRTAAEVQTWRAVFGRFIQSTE